MYTIRFDSRLSHLYPLHTGEGKSLNQAMQSIVARMRSLYNERHTHDDRNAARVIAGKTTKQFVRNDSRRSKVA